MQFTPLELEEVILITPNVYPDSRGFFLETYRSGLFKTNGIPLDFVQDNYSCSVENTLRGLHYQIYPEEQGKLVRCSLGRIFDVAVDIRPHSPTYGKWVAATLDDQTHRMLYIPPGFAHGFVALSPLAHVHYKATREYAPNCERGIRWDDPDIGIPWPIDSPLLSEKDKRLPCLNLLG